MTLSNLTFYTRVAGDILVLFHLLVLKFCGIWTHNFLWSWWLAYLFLARFHCPLSPVRESDKRVSQLKLWRTSVTCYIRQSHQNVTYVHHMSNVTPISHTRNTPKMWRTSVIFAKMWHTYVTFEVWHPYVTFPYWLTARISKSSPKVYLGMIQVRFAKWVTLGSWMCQNLPCY